MTISPEEFADRSIELFGRYREDFGCSDQDFPDELPQVRQEEFERAYQSLCCEYLGHHIVPDNCGLLKCYYCGRCGRKASDLKEDPNAEIF